jgi:tRNA A-37 threonylcarbamoyl transferase component Bud32
MIQTLGKYRIDERVGHGGTGSVFKAYDPLLNRIVALKLVTESDGQMTDEARLRFYKEARACAQLSHPNIITIYDLGEDAGRLFLVQEHLEGEPLNQLLTRGAGLHLERKLAIMMQVCDGLGHAHLKGIVHRVMSPASVFVVRDEKVKLLDFGVGRAALAYGSFTAAAAAMGTEAYMAPEQVGGDADDRSDMFSAAAVFYELLTGRRLEPDERYGDPGRPEPPMPSLFRPDPAVPDDLAAVLERALRRVPAERFARMADMRTGLDEVRARLGEEARTLRRRIVGCAKDTRELRSRLAAEIGGALPDETLPVLEEFAPVAVLEAMSLEFEVTAGQVREQLALAELLRPRCEAGFERLRQGSWAEALATFEHILAEMPQHTRAQEGLDQARIGLRNAGASASMEGEDTELTRGTAAPLSSVQDRSVEAMPSQPSTNGGQPATAESGEEAGESTVMMGSERLKRDLRDIERAGPPSVTSVGAWRRDADFVVSHPGSLRPFDSGSVRAGSSTPGKRTAWRAPEQALPAMVRYLTTRRRQFAVGAGAAVVLVAGAYGLAAYVSESRQLQGALTQARQQADAARKSALAAETDVLARTAFDGASAKEREGARLVDARQLSRAIAALREAEKGYQDARRAAHDAAETRGRADAARRQMLAEKQRVSVGGPEYGDALTREAAGNARFRDGAFAAAAEEFAAAAERFARSGLRPVPSSPPEPSPDTARTSPDSPFTVQADEEIRKVLGLYSQAFQAKDLKLLQQIRPGIRPDELARHRQVFARTQSYRLNLKIDEIRVNGDVAEASGRREDIVVTTDGQTVRTPDNFLFRLKRSNDRWTIDGVR